MAGIAWARVHIAWFYVLSKDVIEDDDRLIECVAAAHADVDDLAGGRRSGASSERCVNDVIHVGEIARLFAVAVYGGLAAIQSGRDKTRNHRRVLRVGILARTEHVEVAQSDRLHAEHACVHAKVVFAR